MMTVTLCQTLQQMLHMWSRTACEKDPWKAQVVEFALGPWRESCGLFLGNSHVWFTVATPSYQSSNHFTRFGLFFKIRLGNPETKHIPPSSLSHILLHARATASPQRKVADSHNTDLGWGSRKETDSQGREGVSLGAAGWTEWVCVVWAGYRTASVIIALTDGELHEDLFFYSEREVSDGPGLCLTWKRRSFLLKWAAVFPLGQNVKCSL